MIAVENVSVFYGRTVALDDLDVSFAPGIVGVFGPNGSGKSTLLRVLAGLLRPSRGRVMLDDAPLTLTDEAQRGRIGYAGHSSGLYARLTLRENLDLFATLYGVEQASVDETLDRLALRDVAEARVDALSAGVKRRAAVARALLPDPDVLLLDEPYANVDDDAAEVLSSALRAWRAPGRVGVVATHGAKKLKAFADAGLILRRGTTAVYGAYGRRPARSAT